MPSPSVSPFSAVPSRFQVFLQQSRVGGEVRETGKRHSTGSELPALLWQHLSADATAATIHVDSPPCIRPHFLGSCDLSDRFWTGGRTWKNAGTPGIPQEETHCSKRMTRQAAQTGTIPQISARVRCRRDAGLRGGARRVTPAAIWGWAIYPAARQLAVFSLWVLWVDGRKGMPDPSRMSRPGIMVLFGVGQWRARR